MAIYALTSYLALTNFGIQDYSLNELNAAWEKNDLKRFHTTYHTASLVYLLVSTASTFLGAGLAIVVVYLDFPFRVESTNSVTAAVAIFLLSSEFTSSFLLNFWANLYRSLLEYPRGIWYQNCKLILLISVSTVVLFWGGGWLEVAITRVVITFGIPLLCLRDIKKRHPTIVHGFTGATWQHARELFCGGSWFMASVAANAISVQGSVILLQAVAGPVVVAQFVLTRTLINMVRQARAVVYHAAWPEITSWSATNQTSKLQLCFLTLQKTSLIISIFLLSSLLLFGDFIFTIWLGSNEQYCAPLFIAFAGLLIAQSSWVTSQVFPFAMNKPRVATIPHLLSACVGLLLGWQFLRYLGSPGLVFGLMLGELLIAAWCIPTWVRFTIDLAWRDVAYQVWLPGLLLIGWMIAVGIFTHQIMDPQSLRSGAVVFICILVSVAAGGWAMLNQHEKSVLFKAVKFHEGEFSDMPRQSR